MLRRASQGPVWLLPLLVDLLVGEVGDRAASIHRDCEIMAAGVVSLPLFPYQILMPMHDFQ